MIPTRIDWTSDGLRLEWQDSPHPSHWPATRLRSACRCAACLTGPGLPDPAVLLIAVELVGHYGLRLFFSDGHDRGIYPWPLLHDTACGTPVDSVFIAAGAP